MGLDNLVKRLQDIMRSDAGVNGDAQRIEQVAWLLFLKACDAREECCSSNVPEELRWRNWAADANDGKALTGDALLNFVNTQLFPRLREIRPGENAPMSQRIIPMAFAEHHNYMKDGFLLRRVINVIDEIRFEDYADRHALGEIYETLLRSLQSAGNAGEFYTPRAVTDFMAQMVQPKPGESIADFACGTGGFLISALKAMNTQTAGGRLYGIEKKALPFLLCATNMLLYGAGEPQIIHANALERDVRSYTVADQFDVILMNPPFGGIEQESVKRNFPVHLRSGETADLFVTVMMYRLKKNGRCAVVLPDGFLFGTDSTKLAIKQMLLSEFNLHTVLRLPQSVFAPYTSIATNILFFDRTGPTAETWFYRLDMPAGYKKFSKTRPMQLSHFAPAIEWWTNRREMNVDGFPKAKMYTAEEIAARGYNMDLCGYPREEEAILPPTELIQQFRKKRASLNADMDCMLAQISRILGIDGVEGEDA